MFVYKFYVIKLNLKYILKTKDSLSTDKDFMPNGNEKHSSMLHSPSV